MATVNYPELLPHPLVSDGYGFRSNQSQAVGLFDVETQSRDGTRTVNVGFTFTDLQYKVFHGWFMNVLVHGQKWFNMRLDGEFYECTFGGVQPQYSLNRKIITVTATLKTRPSTSFVNYTNQRVSYPDAVNYMPSPFDPSGWYGATDADLLYTSVTESNPSGETVVGEFEYIGTGFGLIANANYISSAPAGYYYSCIVCNPMRDDSIGFRLIYWGTAGTLNSIYINASNGAYTDTQGDSSVLFTELGGGYNLIQIKTPYDGSQTKYRSQFNFYKVDTSGVSGGFPDIGDKIKMQAAFFGKTGKYQGAISYNAVNYMPSPFDPSGWSGVSDPDLSYTSISESNPSGESFIGEFEYTGPNSMSIIQGNYQTVTAGDTLYTCFIFKPNPIKYFRIYLQKNAGGSPVTEELTTINGETGQFISGSTDPDEVKVDQLKDGYYLVQVKYTAQESLPYRGFIYCDGDFFFNPPSVGDKVKMQAAYFGKANDWPAIITPADPDQFPAAITYEY